MTDIILTLCNLYPNGWTHEDALKIYEDESLVIAIRDEATSTDGILKEHNGNYTLRSK